MRILSLEIKNIRGIKSIKIEPAGENVVVFGPNGTGKSAIVDAIDFLLTGKISRLMGEGAKSLSLREHGPHVDSRANLKDTVVTAKVKIDKKEITMQRTINKPSTLKVNPKEDMSLVQRRLAVTELGQHILTRRDILQYITAEAGKRAKKIMSLLNLEQVENLRSVLVTLRNEAESEHKQTEGNLEVAKSEITTLLSLPVFSEDGCLEKVNTLRQTLGGTKLSALSVDTIKKDLLPLPFLTERPALTRDQVGNTVEEIRKLIREKDLIVAKEAELRTLLTEICKETQLREYMTYETLIKAGLSLARDNICPLCDQKWNGDFRQYLLEKESKIEIAKQKQAKIEEISTSLNNKFLLLRNYVSSCVDAHKQFGLKVIDDVKLKDYLSMIDSWINAMKSPLDLFESGKWPSDVKKIFEMPFVETNLLAPLDTALKEIGFEFSAQQNAWDTLTRMQDKWERYMHLVQEEKQKEIYKKRADSALDYFMKARDSVLEGIYDAVRSNFEQYYRIIHSDDEARFASKISHEGAELNFQVDFYERGLFPPHALHSEGHQDSMGFCLFLSLNEYLVKNIIELVVLDDVVMSIDCSHRQGICSLLREHFSNKQLIITTHDGAWAKQLRTQGIVKQKNMIHFTNWNIETGPVYELDKDLWDRIEEDLQKDDVPAAAHLLRRNAELFFDDVCDFLSASITYKGSHQWELGDLAPAAISTYKKYLRKAKDNAHKMGDKPKFKELEILEKKSNEIIAKSLVEQWIINDNVHYNRWRTYSKNDFKPVAKAFKDLFGLFTCSTCGSLIALNEGRGKSAQLNVSCNCGKIFWNISNNISQK
jgi:recombinational DNA repair ATPase RecF